VKFYVSLDAREATTAEGQPLVRGETLELTPEQRDDSFNARLIAEGQLISVSKSHQAIRDAEAVLDGADPSPSTPPLPGDSGSTSGGGS
jgi:hypothetical protein